MLPLPFTLSRGEQNRRAANERLAKMEAVTDRPLRVGRQAVPAPIQFGVSHRAIARQRNPKFEGISPVALRQKRKVLFKIAICVRTQSVRAKSRFKWQWRHATAPRAVVKE